jgi:cytidine deaminase
MNRELVAQAKAAQAKALAAYSGFKVGAAIQTCGGRVYTGCNIESATYGLSVCAERVALWKALSDGAREFREVVIVTDASQPTPPCGSCRQLLWEYCGDIVVHLHSSKGPSENHQLSELFPMPFDRGSL